MTNEQFIYATFFTGNGSYLPGLTALKNSLEIVNSKYPLVVFVPQNMEKAQKMRISELGVSVIELKPIPIPKEIVDLNNASNFAHWNDSFLKIMIFSQTAYKKIILLDCDMLVVKNIDHLFSCPSLSAVVAGQRSNPQYRDLNSGLMVIEPKPLLSEMIYASFDYVIRNSGTYSAIGDQDLLHIAFSKWKFRDELHLPETYNLLSDCIAKYLCKKQDEPPIRKDDIYVIHFACSPKPWNYNVKSWKNILLRAIYYKSTSEIAYTLQYLRIASNDHHKTRSNNKSL